MSSPSESQGFTSLRIISKACRVVSLLCIFFSWRGGSYTTEVVGYVHWSCRLFAVRFYPPQHKRNYLSFESKLHANRCANSYLFTPGQDPTCQCETWSIKFSAFSSPPSPTHTNKPPATIHTHTPNPPADCSGNDHIYTWIDANDSQKTSQLASTWLKES